MTDFPGSSTGGAGDPFAYPSRVAAHHARVRRTYAPEDNLEVLLASPPNQRYGTDLTVVDELDPDPPQSFRGEVVDKSTFAFDWFEKFHIEPTSFILGNVLSTQQVAVTLYSAYRREEHTWDAFVNNAGAGVDLLNQPSLPSSFRPQSGTTGLLLEVSPNGPPFVDTVLDFVFDEMTLSPPIQLQRLVLFDAQPELPYTEVLEFLTQVMTHKDGSEMRPSKRKNPRQFFEWSLVLDAGRERSRLHNLLFDWQSRLFGIPMWHELTFPTAAVLVNDTVINVRSTDYADYRVGSLALIYTDSATYDVLEVAAVGPTSITLVNPVLNAYDTRAMVMPLRSGALRPSAPGERYASDAAKLRARFEVLDNDANLADTSEWTTYNSKVLVDDVNALGSGNSMGEEFLSDVIRLDNAVGVPALSGAWDKGKRRSLKTFWTRTRAGLWKVRGLLHALRGRAVSFYLPTFGKDFTPVNPLTSGSNTLTVSNVGYARYVRERVPMNILRVHFTNPSINPPLIRRITGSSEIDVDTEQLTLDATWPSTYSPGDVLRIEYVQLSRLDSDSIRIHYALGDRTARIQSPVITVFDE